MLGPRRRPVLGAALVVGASRASARREVERQSQQQSQQQEAINREAEAKRRQEEEQEARVKKAVGEALAAQQLASRAPGSDLNLTPAQAPMPNRSPSPMLPPRPSAEASGLGLAAQIQTPPSTYHRPDQQGVFRGDAEIAAVGVGVTTPVSSGGNGGPSKAFIVYCPGCGNSCSLDDFFCRKCGRKQPREGRD
ncbi:hypothetical protein B0T16DRAFT_421181 [Cercophora newfieldiana]|uniref:Uncharacterized protein n=1 Tax=Cercophora newfieldiana TaxID=92897 RepID=A0AA39XXT0_9PEZI|nr:hypothetical protein B0T16DRAFT_421181 [Cercophora newfieldiana]